MADLDALITAARVTTVSRAAAERHVRRLLDLHPDRLAIALGDARWLLRHLAQRLCRDDHTADDLVQDTLMRAWSDGIPKDIHNLHAWLATVMHHLFVDQCRAAARQAPKSTAVNLDAIQIEPDVDEPAWAHITLEDIENALEQIEPIYREVYRMQLREKLSLDQIAQRLSIPRTTVATRLYRARLRLRQVLAKRFGPERTLQAASSMLSNRRQRVDLVEAHPSRSARHESDRVRDLGNDVVNVSKRRSRVL